MRQAAAIGGLIATLAAILGAYTVKDRAELRALRQECLDKEYEPQAGRTVDSLWEYCTEMARWRQDVNDV